MAQRDMFEPPRREALSQWFTPAWLARRAACWLPSITRGVLEPSVGSGNLLEGIRRVGIPDRLVVGCEMDLAWCDHARARFPSIAIFAGDFLSIAKDRWPEGNAFDAALTNPPYEGGLDVAFVLECLRLAPMVIAIVKSDFEFSETRGVELWGKAHVQRRAKLQERPQFGRAVERTNKRTGAVTTATTSAERNYVALQIGRGAIPRCPAFSMVREEVWWRDDPEDTWTGPWSPEGEAR